MDGPGVRPLRYGGHTVDGLPYHVKQPPLDGRTHRHGDGDPRIGHVGIAGQSVGSVHGDGPYGILPQVLLYLQHEGLPVRALDFKGVEDCGQGAAFGGEGYVDNGADDLLDFTDIGHCVWA